MVKMRRRAERVGHDWAREMEVRRARREMFAVYFQIFCLLCAASLVIYWLGVGG